MQLATAQEAVEKHGDEHHGRLEDASLGSAVVNEAGSMVNEVVQAELVRLQARVAQLEGELEARRVKEVRLLLTMMMRGWLQSVGTQMDHAPKGASKVPLRKGGPEQSHVQQINALVAEYVAMKTQLEEQHARCVPDNTACVR